MAERTIEMKVPGGQLILKGTVASGTAVEKGKFVGWNTATGYLVELADAANRRFFGIANDTVLAAATTNTDIEVYVEGVFLMKGQTLAVTDNGSAVYVIDDETFDTTSTHNVCCGKLVEYVSATSGWIDIGVAASMTALATAITFADGGAYTHVAALTAVQVDAALEELNLEIDTHIISDGAGGTQDPGTNAEHCAKAVVGWGSGIGYQVLDSGAGIAAEAVSTVNGYTGGIPDVIQSVGTTGAPPAHFYHPAAIGPGAQGVGYKVYTDSAMTFSTAAGAAQDPVYRSATGTLTLTKPSGTDQTQIVGRVLVADATGECQLDLTEGFNLANHAHTGEAEGGEIGAWMSFIITETWTKDGTDQAIATIPAAEVPYAVTVKRCYAAVDNATGGVGTLTVDLNTTLAASFGAADTQAEDESLSIAIAANTDWDIVLNETAGGACDNLKLLFYYTKDA